MNTRSGFARRAAFAASLAFAAAPAFAVSSANYAQREHLLIQWDGIDNAGAGTHDPGATTWKNIAPNATGYDLVLTGGGAWSDGKALAVNGTSATYDAGAAPSCKTIEVVFKMAENKAGVLLYGGNQSTRQLVAFSVSGTTGKCYCEGLANVAHPTVNWEFDAEAMRSVAATFDNPGQVATAMFADGEARTDGSHTSAWGLTTQKIAIGAYGNGNYPWVGEVYTVRMYDCVLTAEEIAANHAIDILRFGEWKPTSADYVQSGLVAQWDGIDNAGTGTHDPAATIWKNLAATGGAYDLTLTANGSWNAEGNALAVSDLSAAGQTAAPEYKTIEVVFKPNGKGRILFASGDQKRIVAFDNDSIAYFSGAFAKGNAGGLSTKCIQENFLSGEVRFLSAEYDDGGAVANVFTDAVRREDGGNQNNWNASGVISIGNRDTPQNANYAWNGEVYAIRLYANRLTKAQLAHNHLVDCKRFLTISSYVRANLIGCWDGIDNAGVGVHDGSSPVWKNLADNGSAYDLTIGTAKWTGNALRCLGKYGTASLAAEAAAGTGTLLYNALEVVFANGANGTASTVVFSGAYTRYFVLGTSYAMWKNNEWTTAFNNTTAGKTSLVWLYDQDNAQGRAFANGAQIPYETHNVTWALTGNGVVHVGGKVADNRYSWNGDLFAIRAYREPPADAQVAYNYKIDRNRFDLPKRTFVWNGGDGFFATNGNWSVGLSSAGVPGAEDIAVLPAGNYTATLDDEWVVDSLSVGAGATLALALPKDGNAPDGVVPLTVLGTLTADSGAGLVLDSAQFDKAHHMETATLIECGDDSAAALQALAGSLNAALGSSRASVSADGKNLVYAAPPPQAFTLIVR